MKFISNSCEIIVNVYNAYVKIKLAMEEEGAL